MNNVEQTKYIVGEEVEVSGWYEGNDRRMHHTHYCTDCALESHVTKSSEWGQQSIADAEIKNGLQRLIDLGCTHVTTENALKPMNPNIWSEGMDAKAPVSGKGRIHSKPTAKGKK